MYNFLAGDLSLLAKLHSLVDYQLHYISLSFLNLATLVFHATCML
jgi:hypothetical protein